MLKFEQAQAARSPIEVRRHTARRCGPKPKKFADAGLLSLLIKDPFARHHGALPLSSLSHFLWLCLALRRQGSRVSAAVFWHLRSRSSRAKSLLFAEVLSSLKRNPQERAILFFVCFSVLLSMMVPVWLLLAVASWLSTCCPQGGSAIFAQVPLQTRLQ